MNNYVELETKVFETPSEVVSFFHEIADSVEELEKVLGVVFATNGDRTINLCKYEVNDNAIFKRGISRRGMVGFPRNYPALLVYGKIITNGGKNLVMMTKWVDNW
jgi:hypothetical protein